MTELLTNQRSAGEMMDFKRRIGDTAIIVGNYVRHGHRVDTRC